MTAHTVYTHLIETQSVYRKKFKAYKSPDAVMALKAEVLPKHMPETHLKAEQI